MPAWLTSLTLLAQAGGPAAAAAGRPQAGPPAWLVWLYLWGEPSFSVSGFWGGAITWLKVVGLFCLTGWIAAWVITAVKERAGSASRTFDFIALGALVVGLAAVLIRVLEQNGRMRALAIGGYPLVITLGSLTAVVLFGWLEANLWGTVKRHGRRGDQLVLIGLHLALALGIGLALYLRRLGQAAGLGENVSSAEAIISGGRLAVTYMGLVVLARVVALLLPEVTAIRFRRLYSIGWQCWVESFRRMAAPWVVIVMFVVVLAFASWFLTPPRAAELGRQYVNTLAFLTTLLLSLMVAVLAPISIPNDIRQQTIYTVVSKPVRRLELIWGRMLGYMALVTALLALFSAISLVYYHRMVDAEIRRMEAIADKARKDGKSEFALQAREQAEQLRTRMSARVPVKGVLSFRDSKGKATARGIDVGQELEYRSFVEGASPSKAIWRFGPRTRDPFNQTRVLDRPVPVDNLLVKGTIEELQNRMALLRDDTLLAQAQKTSANLSATDNTRLVQQISRNEQEAKRLSDEIQALLARERTLRSQGKAGEANALHSPPIPVEMTFNVYRTTKGELGEPVYASLIVLSPRGIDPYRKIFPVREYYTNKQEIPSRMLVGCRGEMTVEVQCLQANQYLGMSESDLFLVSSQGSFDANFLKGLFGVWLQAMVLTAVGVCLGTFLSWPVALLTTIMFGVAGYFGFSSLQMFALQGDLLGGGPFVSLIRLLSHDNQVSDLAPTTAVVVAKTLDSIVMPIMSRLVWLVPNFPALDMSPEVAEGFAVTWPKFLGNVLLAFAYALPFSIAGYFILKNREVAA